MLIRRRSETTFRRPRSSSPCSDALFITRDSTEERERVLPV
jgi:hypothetical protein